MVRVSSGQVSELLGQSETVPHVLRRHKVLRHLDTAVQVVHLMSREKTSMFIKVKETDVSVESWGMYKNAFVINNLTWWGAPAGINTASPKNCTMAQPWTPYSS